MRQLLFSVHLIILIVPESLTAAIPCDLKWVSYNIGDPVPETVVSSHVGSQYVARGKTGGTYHVGRFVPGEAGYFHSGSTKHRINTFDILTNPNFCSLTWLPPYRYNFPLVPGLNSEDKNEIRKFVVSASTGLYVGRAMDASGQWHPGCAYETSSVISMYIGSTTDYQLLVSQVVGFELEVKDFAWLSDPFGSAGMDMLGLDYIYNKSPAESTLTITHTKSVTNSVSFTSTKSSSHTAGTSISAEFFGVTAEAHYEYTTTTEESNTISEEKRTEISVSRAVVVPPLTSIQICSVLKTIDNFEVGYTAHGRFTKKGFNSTQIRDILKTTHYNEDIISNDEISVTVLIEGTFRGSLAMSNQIILLPIDATTGCDELVKSIEKRKLAIRRKERLNESKEELENIMDAIGGQQINLKAPSFNRGLFVPTN